VSRSWRDATDEERALFRDALRQAQPLRRAGAAAKEARPLPETVQRAPLAPRMPIFSHGEAPAIGGHRESHLRRGRIEPEARLDLHGFTQEDAFRSLLRFLERARGFDHRVVLVITGKGGVLKSLLPRWLAESEFARLVSGVGPAHIKHGGGGAFYVALRRKREQRP
jgi:DNA-nicking Smr family endonuclease